MRFLEVAAGDWGHVCVCVCVCVAVALGEFLLLFVEWIDFDEKMKIRQGTAGVAEEKSAVILLTVFMTWGVCVCRDWIRDPGGVALHGCHWNISVLFLSFKKVERPIPFLFSFLKNTYLAALGLSCSTWNLRCNVWDFIAAHRPSNGGTPIRSCSERAPEPHGFSGCSVQALKSWCVGSVVAPSHMGSLFPNQGSNPCPLHCKVSS